MDQNKASCRPMTNMQTFTKLLGRLASHLKELGLANNQAAHPYAEDARRQYAVRPGK